MKATGEFKVTKWNQADMDGAWEGKRLMKVDAAFEIDGEIKGQALVAYLMHYDDAGILDEHDRSATYSGFIHFDGSIGDAVGSFLMEDRGRYENSVPSSQLTIVQKSGTGDFTDLSGSGQYYASEGKMLIQLAFSVIL